MYIIRFISSLLRRPGVIIYSLAGRGLLNWVSDPMFLKLVFRTQMGYRLDLSQPKTFNEKLQWLKINNYNDSYAQLVDKYEVKKYFEYEFGKEYIIPTIGVWAKEEDIDFNMLPSSFVLKCTHDSGSVVICKDISKLNIKLAKKKLHSHLKRNTYWYSREWPYKNIKPRIIAEQLLVSDTGISDYKIHCFNGIPKLILVCKNRFENEGLTEDFYDVEWNHLDLKRPNIPNSKKEIEKPCKLDEMLEISKKIAVDKLFVRVDFYIVGIRIYLGEVTFFPSGGLVPFCPNEWDRRLGDWLKLPIDS